jgi:hypothetical protein
MIPAKIRPVKMWGVARETIRTPYLIPSSIQLTRTEAIAAIVPSGGNWSWKKLYRQGFRAVKLSAAVVDQ